MLCILSESVVSLEQSLINNEEITLNNFVGGYLWRSAVIQATRGARCYQLSPDQGA